MNIYVIIDSLERAYSECERLYNELSSIQHSFGSTANNLDWDIKAEAGIQRYVDGLNDELSKVQEVMNLHINFLNSAIEGYTNAERYIEQETQLLKNNLYGGGTGGSGGTGTNPSNPGFNPGGLGSGGLSNIHHYIYSLFSSYFNQNGVFGVGGMIYSSTANKTFANMGFSFGKYVNGKKCSCIVGANIVRVGNTVSMSLASIYKYNNQTSASIASIILTPAPITAMGFSSQHSSNTSTGTNNMNSTLVGINSVGTVSAAAVSLNFQSGTNSDVSISMGNTVTVEGETFSNALRLSSTGSSFRFGNLGGITSEDNKRMQEMTKFVSDLSKCKSKLRSAA